MTKTLLMAVMCLLTARGADDLTVLSDEFDSAATLDRWQRVFATEGWGNDALESLTVSSGALEMVPHTSSWYAEWRGELFYRTISGNFVMTTQIEPRSRSRAGAPNALYSLAGIMVRAPRSMTSPDQWTAGGQNYMFLSLGTADQPGSYQYEVKTTVNSVSTLQIQPGVPAAEIQVARVGPHFLMLRRDEGGEWVVHRRYYRPDMPQTLQAGLTVYTDWPRCELAGAAFHNTHVLTNGTVLPGGAVLTGCFPDLHARFEFARFSRPNLTPENEHLEFSNPLAVSDQTIVTLFGRAANTPGGALVAPQIHWRRGATGLVEMEVEVVPERSYRLERSADLAGWATERSFVTTSTSERFELETAGGADFYRVVTP